MFRFKGPANIYLEGREALQFCSNGNGMIYYVGAPESTITIHDFRLRPGEAAKKALSGLNVEAFADIFSQPGYVEVNEQETTTEIILRDHPRNEDSPITLWIGVLHDNMMSVRRSFWEQVKFLDTNQVAFAALLDD